MPKDLFQVGNNSLDDIGNEIHPGDTYGSRFSVKSRSTSNNVPRSAITVGHGRLRGSDKIFGKHSDFVRRGGSVNMKNVSEIKDNKKSDYQEKSIGDDTLRSSGLDSLFGSTNIENKKNKPEDSSIPKNNNDKNITKNNHKQVTVSSSNRGLKIIRPISYSSAANELSKSLKAGYAVVLCLKGTHTETSKRILDFAFGAASMCGAQVSLDAEKTYVITVGPGLSQREKLLCIKDGIAIKQKTT